MSSIFEDCRKIVDKSDVPESKKTVAMNCIRGLEENSGNVSALIPMLLEVYFNPVEKMIIEAVKKHADDCVGKGGKVFALVKHVGWSGVIIVAIVRLEAISKAFANLF